MPVWGYILSVLHGCCINHTSGISTSPFQKPLWQSIPPTAVQVRQITGSKMNPEGKVFGGHTLLPPDLQPIEAAQVVERPHVPWVVCAGSRAQCPRLPWQLNPMWLERVSSSWMMKALMQLTGPLGCHASQHRPPRPSQEQNDASWCM